MGTTPEWPFGNCPLQWDITVGLSARQADLDNIFKPLLDTFQVIYEYEFNDNKVYRINARKCIVPKGREFIRLRITETAEPEAQFEGQQEQTNET